MKKNKYQIITLSISALVILVSIIGYTYSYFSANVNEVNKTQTIVKTNELNITYTGGQEINAGNMIPGDSFTKTFSVENTSNKEVTFNIYMENIINEFNEDLVFSLRDEEGTLINNRILPTTNEGKSYLKAKLTIGANKTKNYTLTTLYKYLNVPQGNQGATFSATVGIDTAQNITTDYKGILATTYQDNKEAFYGQRENITKVVFENELVPKENATYTYDVSEGQDKSVMSYLVENAETPSTYTLYIQGEESIKANEDSRYLFYKFINLTEIEGLEYLDTSNVTTMLDMFAQCTKLVNLDLSHFDTSNVTSMYEMFYCCYELQNIVGLQYLNTSKVTNMAGMFSGCKKIMILDLSSFDTSNLINMDSMFFDCNQLTSLDVGRFNTSNVITMRNVFGRCSSLTNLDLSNFNTSKVYNMNMMFGSCTSLTNLDISNFDINKVTNSSWMFGYIPSDATIKVKDETVQTWVLNTEGRPSSWTTENVIIAS